ncbi:unnamed protein product [Bursaphelenchus xylophilus]|uniref:(pine wood nematode) hypothetical protein n=1 Tax=Bursaphelenchus xylophilus TaxID=6326 RepID=A0A1I7SDQ8_BURXY|nr:unnamed protein product [Bursaphelenchus xylophilus]CAG9084415.1 unnamed protein product [Bursaphelenchus xylophilus]
MTSFYEAATSGRNYDRFATDDLMGENTLIKMKQHFWTAKQLLRNKLGKKEDDCLTASDAEFDSKLTSFYSIRDSSRNLMAGLEDLHHFFGNLQENNKAMGVLLIKQSRFQKAHVAKAMESVGQAQSYAYKSSGTALNTMVKMYRDLDTFFDRAVNDCAITVEAAERARTEYRGSLLWMKKSSEELDPESEQLMDQYRTAQAICRQNKEKFDQLKEDTFHKTDVLSQSRTKLLVATTQRYIEDIGEYIQEMSKSYSQVADELKDIDNYEIDVLTILNDPMSLVVEKNKAERPEVEDIPPSRKGEDEDRNECEQGVKSDLIGFESEPESDKSRADSPLGELPETIKPENLLEDPKSFVVGPLPTLYSQENQQFPKIEPPSGWINKVKCGAQDILNLNTGNRSEFMPSELVNQALELSKERSTGEWDDWITQFDPLQQNQQQNSSEI